MEKKLPVREPDTYRPHDSAYARAQEATGGREVPIIIKLSALCDLYDSRLLPEAREQLFVKILEQAKQAIADADSVVARR